MSNNQISGNESLTQQILQMKAERAKLEEGLNQSFGELTHVFFDPSDTTKEKPDEEKDGKRILINFSKIALNMGTDYIIEQSFGKRKKFSDFLTSIMIELVSIPLINKGISKIFAGIDRSLFGEYGNE
ncbi:MAG: hypothetical protein JW729_05565 [Bacteroidales bacterium]|nr:hypothetical protein [Bacteroidales bacterium]